MIDKITLDSNVFKDQEFINYLMDNQNIFSNHYLPLIVYIELLVWYEMIGLVRKDLDEDLELLKSKVYDFPQNGINTLLSNIRSNKNLQFRHHARDFLIGTQSMLWNSVFITIIKIKTRVFLYKFLKMLLCF
jgi:hypothetical protein